MVKLFCFYWWWWWW